MIRFSRLKNWPCLGNLFNRLVYFSLNNFLRNIPQIKLRMINILLHAFEKTFHSLRSPPNCMHGSLAWLAPHVVGFVIFDYSDIYSVLNLKMHCITIHVTHDVFGFDWANNLCRIILIEILEFWKPCLIDTFKQNLRWIDTLNQNPKNIISDVSLLLLNILQLLIF